MKLKTLREGLNKPNLDFRPRQSKSVIFDWLHFPTTYGRWKMAVKAIVSAYENNKW